MVSPWGWSFWGFGFLGTPVDSRSIFQGKTNRALREKPMHYGEELKQRIPEGVLQFCAVAVLGPEGELRTWLTLSPQDNLLDCLGDGGFNAPAFPFLGVVSHFDGATREAVVCLVFVGNAPINGRAPFEIHRRDFEGLDPRLPFLRKGPSPGKPQVEYWRHCRGYIGHDLLFAPAAGALVLDDEGRMLLQRRGDDGTWGILGGGSEVGESPVETALREVFEETGLQVRLERLLSVATGDDCLARYPNGDRGKFWGFLFSARIVGGAMISENEETLELRWFHPHEVEHLENGSLYLKHNYANWRNQRTLIHAKKLNEPPV